jgi:hypothetical protein
MRSVRTWCVLLAAASLVAPADAGAQDAPQHDAEALAKQTQNPVSALVSVPFQFNLSGAGDLDDRALFNLNLQPVIPFRLTPRINVIARTIVPLDSAPGPGGTRYTGLGDIQSQLFLTAATPGPIIFGIGPTFSLPTATAAHFETGTFAAGISAVVVKDHGPWVLGGLVSQLWPVADTGGPPEMHLLTVQPFVNYNFGGGWALSFAPIFTANWDAPQGEEWTAPLGLGITRTTVFNRRPLNLGFQYYRNLEYPAGAAGQTFRFVITLLYPQPAGR